MDQQTPENRTRRRRPQGAGLAIGIALGVALGVAFHNLALGIALGVALGCAFEGGSAYQNRCRR